jgi:signal transduction histidine kinase/DNA-binding response OmpR family regulator
VSTDADRARSFHPWGGADAASLDLGPTGPPRILVVDDEETVADLCQEFLGGEGYELKVARSGEEAVRLLPQVRPDVVLTDINMPGLTGLEVMRFAKEADPEVCVVVVTGHASTASAIDALRQGAYDYVTKPFDLEAVHKIIKSGLAHRRLKVLNRELIEELRRKNEILQHHEQELRERVRIATARMTTLYEVGKEISANLELGPRLEVICQKAAETTGGRGALVFLMRESENDFVASAAHGVADFLAEPPASFLEGQSDLGVAALERRTVRRSLHENGDVIEIPGLPAGATSLLALPMVAEGQVIGVLATVDKPGGFSDDDESFLALFASQSAIAVRNSQLFENTKSLDRLKSEFVAVVSHEIRTPLTSVKGAIELLTDDRYFRNNDQQIKLLAIAHANTERLLTLIGDILDFSKLDSGSLPMHFEKLRIEPVVTQAVQNLRTLIEDRRIQLEVVLDPELPDVTIDPNRIAQVVTNLLSNAIKFSPAEGELLVTVERWEGLVRVGVRDHGEGIAADNLPKLFKKFTQIDSTSTRRAGGTGLGLVICKGIVEQHGGTMSVESTVGLGSTFYFTLPAVPLGSAPSPTTAPAASL